MALKRRCPDAGLLHDSDQGCTHASEDYQRRLDAHGVTCSMSRRGNCYDNAVMEAFFSSLKSELADRFDSCGEAKMELFDYIEVFYNQRRRHSTIGYVSPAVFERQAFRDRELFGTVDGGKSGHEPPRLQSGRYAESRPRQTTIPKTRRPLMMRTGLIAAFIVLVMGDAGATDAPHVRLQASAPWNDYDDFMKLSVHQRHARFDTISAENKAMIVRTHSERWLYNNRGRLTASEVEVFEEIIAFVTPDLYRERHDDTLDKREEALRAKMRCRVSPADIREATSLFREASESASPKLTWSYLTRTPWIGGFAPNRKGISTQFQRSATKRRSIVRSSRSPSVTRSATAASR